MPKVKIERVGGTTMFVYRDRVFNPMDARFRYGDNLKALLDKHKKVWKEVETYDDHGRLKRYHLEVGGNEPDL